jgi:Transcriptional regulator/sugar kinase
MTDVRPVRPNGVNGIMRPSNVREANAVAILKLLLLNGALPRAEISRLLGLTQGTVTRIVADLADQGLVQEREPVNGTTRGRPRVPIDLVPDSRLTIGVHIGVRIVHAALVNLRGEAVLTGRAAHDGSVAGIISDAARLIRDLRQASPTLPLGVGVIIGGWVEPGEGRVRRHQLLNWRDVDLARLLTAETGMDILVESSVRAHALADLIFGDAKGHSSFAHVFVGHVVEASLVFDSRMHAGPEGIGGSLENWTMDDGHGRSAQAWEVISDSALIAKAQAANVIDSDGTFEDLVETAKSDGPIGLRALQILNHRAFQVGTLIAAVTDLLGLSLFILSSGVIAEEGAIDYVRQGLEAARPGLPAPELRAEINSPETLTRAASSVVLASTVLNVRDLP